VGVTHSERCERNNPIHMGSISDSFLSLPLSLSQTVSVNALPQVLTLSVSRSQLPLPLNGSLSPYQMLEA
jgi:hypothetical protein